jgi:hypothetical protein
VTLVKDVYAMIGINKTDMDNIKSGVSKVGVGIVSLLSLGLLL